VGEEGGRVVVGVHGSVGSLAALRHAVAEARRRDAVVHSVLVWSPPGGDVAEQRYPDARLRRIWAGMARERLRTAWHHAMGGVPDDVPVRLRVARGEPGAALIELADRPDDLLVVGAGQARPLRRLLRRGVARYCLTRAACPVLVVPEPTLARALGRRHRRAVADLLRTAARDYPGNPSPDARRTPGTASA
jgi:nucleotide-binding universal stress UspA family protein